METNLKNEKGEIYYRSALGPSCTILFSNWIGQVDEIDLAKAACLSMVESVNESKVHRVLNDNRQQVGEWPDVHSWLVRDWIPKLSCAGLKYFAHVISSDRRANVEPQRLFNRIINDVEFVTFNSFESAHHWLELQE